MTELPYYKSFPSEWLTGDIAFEEFATKGAFADLIAYYWSKGCKISLAQMKRVTKKQCQYIIDSGVVKIQDGIPRIDFLDKQYQARTKQHERNVENGRKGGFQKARNHNPYLKLQPEVLKRLKND